MDELMTLNKSNTHLPSHCDMRLTNGIDMSTGSLGQGFSAATGMAIAGKWITRTLFIPLSGMVKARKGRFGKRLCWRKPGAGQFCAFTDYNKMQLDGYIENINGLYRWIKMGSLWLACPNRRWT